MEEKQKLILNIKNKIKCMTNSGLYFEMKDYFEECEDIEDYTITTSSEEEYYIKIKFKNFSLSAAENIFIDFMLFIQYSGGNLYCKNKSEELIEYDYISFDEFLEGFYIKITFM